MLSLGEDKKMVSKEYADNADVFYFLRGIFTSVCIAIILTLIVVSFGYGIIGSEWKCNEWQEVSREKLYSETEPTGKNIENVQCEKEGKVDAPDSEYDYWCKEHYVKGICDSLNYCKIWSYEKVQKNCVEEVLVRKA